MVSHSEVEQGDGENQRDKEPHPQRPYLAPSCLFLAVNGGLLDRRVAGVLYRFLNDFLGSQGGVEGYPSPFVEIKLAGDDALDLFERCFDSAQAVRVVHADDLEVESLSLFFEHAVASLFYRFF